MANEEKTPDERFIVALLFGAAAALLLITGAVVYWYGVIALQSSRCLVSQVSLI